MWVSSKEEEASVVGGHRWCCCCAVLCCAVLAVQCSADLIEQIVSNVTCCGFPDVGGIFCCDDTKRAMMMMMMHMMMLDVLLRPRYIAEKIPSAPLGVQ